MIKLILLILSVILFALLGLSIAIGSLNLLAWGLFFLACSFLPIKD